MIKAKTGGLLQQVQGNARDIPMSLKMLRNGFRQRLLRRLLGWRLKHQILYDHITISKLGNRGYLDRFPNLIAPGQQPPFTAYEFSY
ncbi:MAG: hypothetical protein WD709_07465, partial [Gammaproteobacteria bacterium]